MKKVMIGVAFVAMFFTVGCPSGKGLCKSGVDLSCSRWHECATAEMITGAAAFLGTDLDDCKTIGEAASNCELVGNKDQNCAGVCTADSDCPSGETCDTDSKRCSSNLVYGLGQASKCKKGTLALSCDDILDPTKFSDECADSSGNNLVCTAG